MAAAHCREHAAAASATVAYYIMNTDSSHTMIIDATRPAALPAAPEDRFRRIFQYSTDAISIGNIESGRYLEVNDEFVRMSGYSREQVIGRTPQELGFWVDSEKSWTFVKDLLCDGVVRNHETIVTVSGGRRLTVLISAVLIEVDGQRSSLGISLDITDLKHAQQELSRADRCLREVLSNAPVIMTVMDRDGIVTLSEGAGLRSIGLAPRQLVGDSIYEIVGPDSAIANHVRAAFGGTTQVATVNFNERILEAWYSPVLNERQKITGAMSVATDITERVRAEEELRRKEAYYQSLIETSADTVLAINAAATVIFVGGKGPRDFGFLSGELVGRNAIEFVHRDNQLEQATLTREAFQNPGTIVRSEARVRGRDGSWIPVEFSGCVSEGPDGNPILVATMRNIAERKRAQEELRRREEYFRSLIEASSDFIVAIDRGGIVVFAGGRGLRDLVDEPSEVVGHTAAEFEHPDDIPEQIRMVRWSFENPGQVVRTEVRLRGRGGDWIPFEFAGRVITGADATPHLITTGRNITERKRIESELAAARDAALAASRAKSEFVSSMSHEIRTPMNAILGMADLLWETGLSAEQRRYLATVVSNGSALLELINSVLDFAKVESGRMSLERAGFDLIDLVEHVAEMFAARAHEKHLELAVRIAPGLAAAVEGDALRLRQILINLVGNAIKFTERGEVVISVAPAAESKTSDGQMIEFTVTDSGIGLSAAELAAIFEPFTQADSSTTRRYGGSGLGLAIVERLAALMGGRVWVESSTGAGSSFHFTARLGAPLSGTDAPARSERDRAPELHGRTILIVEEHTVTREILTDLLSGAGATVLQAACAADGLTLLKRASADAHAPALILAEAAADGCAAMLERMRKEHPDIAVVMMLTADTMAQTAAAMNARGIRHYVVKPVRRRELFSAIAGALAPREELGCAPAAVATPAPGGGARQPAPRILDRPLRVLLADDSPDNRMLIEAYLKKTPYQLATAENGRVAFDKFVAAPADVILMDIQMPVLDGYGAARMIRSYETDASRARTPIIALSASALDESVSRAREAGCDLHVSKPVKRATLLNAIADAVEPLSALT